MSVAAVPTEGLFQIISDDRKPLFCAGYIVRGGRVTEAAPIIRYMVGWNQARVLTYVLKREWIWWMVPT